MAEQTLNGVPVTGLQQWLKENPNDARAPQLREKLRGIGVDAPDPPVPDPLYGRTILQGALLDPIEKAGQVAEHLPDWLGGGVARRAGSAIMSTPGVGRYLRENQEAAAEHPIVRSLANVLPWLAVPGIGEGMAADVGTGALAGALQPQDPKDPNYWRNLLTQGAVGGLASGAVGRFARSAADAAAQRKAYETAQAAADRFHAQTPERATLGMLRRAYNEIGEPARAPTSLTPQTAQQTRDYIGGKLNSIYARMAFDPRDPGWQTLAASTYRTIRGALNHDDALTDWRRAFEDEALRPVLTEARRAIPITGAALSKIIQNLGERASYFGEKAEGGGRLGAQYNEMAEGMRRLRDAMTQQLERKYPALAKEMRATNRGYHFASTVADATKASQPAATPEQLINTWERKVGKPNYAKPRYGSSKDMLQREHATQQAGPTKLLPPPTKPTSNVRRGVAHAAVDALAIEAAHRLGLPFPWGVGFATGAAITEGGRRLAQTEAAKGAAALLARHPGAVGAAASQAAGPTTDLVLPPITITAQPPTNRSLTP